MWARTALAVVAVLAVLAALTFQAGQADMAGTTSAHFGIGQVEHRTHHTQDEHAVVASRGAVTTGQAVIVILWSLPSLRV